MLGRRNKRRILLSLALGSVAPLMAFAQQSAAPVRAAGDANARAQEVLKAARIALWDEVKSQTLQSISISANRKLTGGGTQTDMIIEALFPDRFRQSDE